MPRSHISNSEKKGGPWTILRKRWRPGFPRNHCVICPILIASATSLAFRSYSLNGKRSLVRRIHENPGATPISFFFRNCSRSGRYCRGGIRDLLLADTQSCTTAGTQDVYLQKPSDQDRQDLY